MNASYKCVCIHICMVEVWTELIVGKGGTKDLKKKTFVGITNGILLL